MKHNPDDYCPRCDHRFGTTDEVCTSCGLDPVGNDEDEEYYYKCKREWDMNHDKR